MTRRPEARSQNALGSGTTATFWPARIMRPSSVNPPGPVNLTTYIVLDQSKVSTYPQPLPPPPNIVGQSVVDMMSHTYVLISASRRGGLGSPSAHPRSEP